MAEPVLCPVVPELVEQLRRPGGMVTRGPARIWLDQDNVLNVRELTEAEQLSEVLWAEHSDGDDRG
jgi:hypothetical protein